MHKILLEKRDEILAFAVSLGITELYVANAGNDTSVYSITALINFRIPPHLYGNTETYIQRVITEFSNYLNTLFNVPNDTIKVYHKASMESLVQTALTDPRRDIFQMMLLSSIPLAVVENKDLFQQFAERVQRLSTPTQPLTSQETPALQAASASTSMPPPSSPQPYKKRRDDKRADARNDKNDSTLAQRMKTKPKAPTILGSVPAVAGVSFWQPEPSSACPATEIEPSSTVFIAPSSFEPVRTPPLFIQNPFSPGYVPPVSSSSSTQTMSLRLPPADKPRDVYLPQDSMTKNVKIKALLLALQNHANKNIWTVLTNSTIETLQELQTRLIKLSDPKTSQTDMAEKNLASVNPQSTDIIDSIITLLKRDPELWSQAKTNPSQIVLQLKEELSSVQMLIGARFKQLSL